MKKTKIGFLFLFFNISLCAHPESVFVNTMDTTSINVLFQMPQFSVNDTVLPSEYNVSQVFSCIHVDDSSFGIIDSVGLPILPQLSINLHLPKNAYGISVSVQPTNMQTLNLSHPFLPKQEDITQNTTAFSFAMDTVYYSSNVPLVNTTVLISEEFIMFGEKGVSLSIFPFEYFPQNNVLSILLSAVITITYSLDSENRYSSRRAISFVEDYLEHAFVNYSSSNIVSNDANYLIITAPDFETGIAYFANYKRNLGYNVTIVTTNTIGTDASEIKSYIEELYGNTNTRPVFVLLVGDTNFIPASAGTSNSIDDPVTDLEYTLLEGNDYKADVFLGRFPVSSTQELFNIINKTVFMETNLSLMPNKAAFVAGEEDNSWMQNYFEKGHNYVVDNTFQPNGFLCTKLFQPQENQVLQELSNNPLYLLYSGHGDFNKWAIGTFDFLSGSIIEANNTVFPFTFAFACKTGLFSASNSICNSWVSARDKGSVTYFGSSVNTYCHSDYIIEKKIFNSDFSQNASISSIINNGMNAYRLYFWGWFNRKRVIRYLKSYNLLGDPSLIAGGYGCLDNLIFNNPEYFLTNEFTEYHVSSTITNYNTFQVNNGAKVRLQAGREIILKNGFHAAEGAVFKADIVPCEAIFRDEGNLKETSQSAKICHETIMVESLLTQGMTIHPNPNTGKFHITLCDKQDMMKQVAVFGILGNPMVMMNNPQSEAVDISRLPSGIYVVKVLTNLGNVYFEKIVKE